MAVDPTFRVRTWCAWCLWTSVLSALVDVETAVPELSPLGPLTNPTLPLKELSATVDPVAFQRDIVLKRSPVVLRGAALDSPAIHRWSARRIGEEYGDLRVKLEKRQENDSGRLVGAEGGLGRSSLRAFVSQLQHADAYVISQMPSPMHKDIVLPTCLSCAASASRLLEASVINLMVRWLLVPFALDDDLALQTLFLDLPRLALN
jgi:hypothetical protein